MRTSAWASWALVALLLSIVGCGSVGETALQTGEAGLRTLVDLLLTDLTNQVADALESGETPPADDGEDGGGGDDQPTDGVVSFSSQIQPIFDARCTVCHAPGRSADLQGIPHDLRAGSAYDDLVNQPSVQRGDLTLVVPGDPDSSLLFLVVSTESPPVGSPMPLGGPSLSENQIELIRQWIVQGAENN